MLTLIDKYTRECLAIRVARRLGSYEIIEALADVMLWARNHTNHSRLCIRIVIGLEDPPVRDVY
jgi:hypothetical protein